MTRSKGRPYHSPARRQRAAGTRRRIVQAARELLLSRGFEGSTVEAIAAQAGVAPQTVYASFGSKRGILKEILRSSAYGPRYQHLVQQALASTDAEERLRFVSRIARQIYDTERSVLGLMQGAGVVAPELAALEDQREEDRYASQKGMARYLLHSGKLRPGLRLRALREIVWTMTSRDIYRKLVVECSWSAARYEVWLGDLLVKILLKPPRKTAK